VCRYWPEFAQNGKQDVTVRQLLGHQAGLFAFDEPVDAALVADPDRLAAVLARQAPAWEPGSRVAYHALTLGFHEGELLRRIDPAHRTLGRFFHEEIAVPLAADAYVRLPASIPDSRLAKLENPGLFTRLREFPLRLTLDALNPRSNIHRALVTNPGAGICLDAERVYARDLEVPSGGGVCSARGLARAYAAFAAPGGPLGLSARTVEALAAPPEAPAYGFHDECLHGDVRFSLGFMKPGPVIPFGTAAAFGSPGAGGAMGYADPATGIAYAYVTSQMGATLSGDPRDVALRSALDASLA
jgi:CubicO group peptidase (beta-lactamase class C family)